MTANALRILDRPTALVQLVPASQAGQTGPTAIQTMAWPKIIDERDMDEVKRLSERELDLLDKLLASSVESNRIHQDAIVTHTALLDQLRKTDSDQEGRIRILERLYWGAAGAIGLLLSALGITKLYGWLGFNTVGGK